MNPLTRGLVSALNHLLAQAPWARERLGVFSGSQVRFRADPLDIRLDIDAQGWLTGTRQPDVEPDVTISIPLGQLPIALAGGTRALTTAVHIGGNAELADALGFVSRHLSWDAEEDLAHLVGDVAAHRLARSAHSFRSAQERAFRSLAGNLSEYLVEEGRLLVGPAAIAAFGDEVRNLRDGVARLEKSIDRAVRARPRKRRISAERQTSPGDDGR